MDVRCESVPGVMGQKTGSLAALPRESENEDIHHALVTHIAGLQRYARALLGDPSEADDLVQECLQRALSQSRPWRTVRDVRAYLFTILHNVHADHMRQRRKTDGGTPLENAVRYLATPATQYKRMELKDLGRAMAKLREEQRQVILLVGLEGMTYQEVADILGVPVGTVMSRLSRGREALRQLMAGDNQAYLRMLK